MKRAVNYDPSDIAHVDCFWLEGVVDADSELGKTTFYKISCPYYPKQHQIKTFTHKIVFIHSAKKSIDHSFLGLC